MDMIGDLYEMCETLGRALKKANDKIRNSGGELSASDMDYVNKLSHALKSVVTTAAMKEAETDGESYGDSYRGDYSRDGRSSYRGGSYGMSGDDGSYARGRGRNARRDSMGRYSRNGYSRDYSRGGDAVEQLRELMQDAPDDQTRQEFQRLIQKMEQQ